MLDGFCKKFISLYGPVPAELVSQEALAFLHGAFDLCELDVASIESRHAVVRHLQETKGSTWQVILQSLSADHLLRQASLQNVAYHELLDGAPSFAGVKKFPLQRLQRTSRRKQRANPARVHRHGGAQRAFFHVRMRAMGNRAIRQQGLAQCISVCTESTKVLMQMSMPIIGSWVLLLSAAAEQARERLLQVQGHGLQPVVARLSLLRMVCACREKQLLCCKRPGSCSDKLQAQLQLGQPGKWQQ